MQSETDPADELNEFENDVPAEDFANLVQNVESEIPPNYSRFDGEWGYVKFFF